VIRFFKFSLGGAFAFFGMLSVALGCWLLEMPLSVLLRDWSRRVPVPESPAAPSLPDRRAEMVH
jgi:hypothetical protein